MNSISGFFEAPLHISTAANAKWLAICEAVPDNLEVYAFLLCRPDDPMTIVNCYLPRQTVSGGRCSVRSGDVVKAGLVASRAGLAVAGSIHRHPFCGAGLSSVDDELLDGMAKELASEIACPVKVTRRSADMTIHVDEASSRLKSPKGRRLAPGVYKASEVEVEETVMAARVYCLVWSPKDGYSGKAAGAVYDPFTGTPHHTTHSIETIEVEERPEEIAKYLEKMKRLSDHLVKRQWHFPGKRWPAVYYAAEDNRRWFTLG